MKPILYLTQDGLLEPLIFSQVVRVLERLSGAGRAYRVLSLEKVKDLAEPRRVRELRARLQAAEIEWEFVAFDDAQTVSSAGRNLGFLAQRALALARSGAIRGLHARAYVPGAAALAAWTATRVPWVFDARGYWIDERLEEGRWFTSPIRLGVARGVEHQLFTTASAVVTLTELQAAEVRERFSPLGPRPVRCITTLADYEDFRRRPIEALHRVPAETVARLRDRRVFAIIGSINRSYLVDETLDLAKRILMASPLTHLLVLSGQREEYERRLAAMGVTPERYTVARAEHEAMPQWLSLVEWCLLLLQPHSPAKRASMPTKLGELFAAGVRPIQFGCNAEVSEWVRRAGTGVVLEDVSGDSLNRAARLVAETAPLSPDACEAARRVTADHFALDAGVARYDALLSEVFGR